MEYLRWLASNIRRGTGLGCVSAVFAVLILVLVVLLFVARCAR